MRGPKGAQLSPEQVHRANGVTGSTGKFNLCPETQSYAAFHLINTHAQIATRNQQTDRLGIIRIAALLGDGRCDGVGTYIRSLLPLPLNPNLG